MKLNFIFAAICILACFPGYQPLSLSKRAPGWARFCGIQDPPIEDNYVQHCVYEKKAILCIKVCKPGFQAYAYRSTNYLKDISTCELKGYTVSIFNPPFSCTFESPGYTEQLPFTIESNDSDEEDDSSEEGNNEK